jgi:hypothetical protein
MPEDTGSNGPRAGKPWNPYGDADAGSHRLSYLHGLIHSFLSMDIRDLQVKGLSLSMPSFTSIRGMECACTCDV